MDVNGSTGPPQPVPQALYVNNSALNLQPSFLAATSIGQNQVPSSASLGVVSNGRTLVSSHSNPPLNNLPPPLRGAATVQPGPPPALVPVTVASSRAHLGPLPPPYTEAVTSNIRTQRSSQSQPQTAVRSAPPTTQSVTNTTEGMKVSLEAHQIRVGTRKFMPASNVVFKDDGVLFTIREYTNAPLLLNARAINRCKANLNEVHPVLFFALEGSCIKQIRSIFNMSEDEFNDKDVMEKKRCITVFPKNLTSEEAVAIHHSFNSMKAKFGRVDPIVFPIDMDTAIDIIYGTGDRPTQQPTSMASSAPSRQSVSNGVSSNTRSHPYQRQAIQQPQQQHHQLQRQPQHQQQQQHRMQSNLLTQSLNQNNMMLQSMQQPRLNTGMRLPLPPNMGQPRLATQQPITIPQDGASFALLQKTLQPNMIYPVIQPNESRRVTHCVWTGTTFQPLPMDEIRLQCQNARVGSLRCQSQEPVIIKQMGTRLGIQFKLKVGSDPPIAFQVYEDELQHCFICFQRICAMFLFPNTAFCQRVRYTLKMKPGKDPTFDNNSNEERQRHLILFLRDITPQAKDELLKLKRMVAPGNKALVSELDAQGALKILASIKSNTPPNQGKITDYMADRYNPSNGAMNSNALESLALEIATVDPAPAPPDDDDDDVIMTSEELTIKCPYTQQVMKEPVRNKNCSHNYEKMAIIEFIARRRAKGTDKTAKCPYAGCGNQLPLTIEDLEENAELKEYIRRKTAAAANTPPASVAT